MESHVSAVDRVVARVRAGNGYISDVIRSELSGSSPRPHERRALIAAVHATIRADPFPDWLEAEIRKSGGEALLSALREEPPQILRCNLAKNSRDELIRVLAGEGQVASPTALAPAGLQLAKRIDLWRFAPFLDGRFEAQDEGSQLISELVAPPPKGRVVDACAGAGGKTLHLAGLLRNKGQVVALDIESATQKLDELRRRARRADLHNITTKTWSDDLSRFEGWADRVLVDAPCSGFGVLRRNPELRYRSSQDKLQSLPTLQKQIVEQSLRFVRPGGRLIYVTCTFRAEENEAVVQSVLDGEPSLELVLAKEILGRSRAEQIGDGTYLRVGPDTHGTDGFFAAVLRKPR